MLNETSELQETEHSYNSEKNNVFTHYAMLKYSHLESLLNFCGKGDIRCYFNGICVRDGKLEATDGHALAIIKDDHLAAFPEIIIPREAVEKALKLFKEFKKSGLCIPLFYDSKEKYGFLGFKDSDEVGFTSIDGRFPDTEQLIPLDPSGEVSQFDPYLLMKFQKASESLAGKKVKCCLHIAHNGTASAKVTIQGHPEFIGVVMPYRS